MKIIFFDTETTGLDCRNCQIIELAMITVIDGEIVDEYDKFIKINGALPQDIVRITGITDEMLESEGVDEKTVADDLKKRLTQDTLMVAHNAQFDLSFVYYLLKRHYPNDVDDIVENLDWLDTVTVLKDRKEYPHKLVDAVDYYNIERVNFHRAIDDTKALYEVYKKLKYDPLYTTEEIGLYKNIFGYNPKYPLQGKILDSKIIYKKQSFHKFPNESKRLPLREILPNK